MSQTRRSATSQERRRTHPAYWLLHDRVPRCLVWLLALKGASCASFPKVASENDWAIAWTRRGAPFLKRKACFRMSFNQALLIELRSNPVALRRIAAKLVEKAEEGELAAIREIADRLDGKPAQVIDRRDVLVIELSDEELLAISAGGLPEHEDAKVSLLPPGPKSTR